MNPKHGNEDVRLALLEQSIGHINETLLRMEKRFDAIDKRFDKVEGDIKQGFTRLDDKIDKVNNRLWTNFFWILGSFAGIAWGMLKFGGYFVGK